MGKREDWIKNNNIKAKLNYETYVDVFLPDAPKVSTDPPYRPEEYMDDYELQKAYKEICSKKLKTKQDKNIEIYSENKE